MSELGKRQAAILWLWIGWEAIQGLASLFGIIVDAEGAFGWLQSTAIKMTDSLTADLIVPITFLVALAYVTFWPSWIHKRRRLRRGYRTTPSTITSPEPMDIESRMEASLQEEQFWPQYNALQTFFIDHVASVAEAQLALQNAVLTAGLNNENVRSLAEHGLRGSPFYSSYLCVAGKLGSSPAGDVSLETFITNIHNAEVNYLAEIEQTRALAASLGVRKESTEETRARWEDWRVKHNALIDAYNPIKRDRRMGQLYRPIRESKWGDQILPNATWP